MDPKFYLCHVMVPALSTLCCAQDWGLPELFTSFPSSATASFFPQFYLYGPSKAMWFRQGVFQPQVQGISFDWSKLAMVACMPFAM